ncbi:MAG: hypothetical protein ACRCZ9_12115 [Fusobacteriaceae bacterium]
MAKKVDNQKFTVTGTDFENKDDMIKATTASMADHLYSQGGFNVGDLDKCFYSTGFPILDYLTGRDIKDSDGVVHTRVRGLRSATLLFASGIQQTGKTTLLLQIAGNVVRPITGAQVYYIASEDGMELSRIQDTTGLNDDDLNNGKLVIVPRHASKFEDLRRIVDDIIEYKVNNQAAFKEVRTSGKGVQKEVYVPTIIVIDSWSAMTSTQVEDKDAESGVDKFRNTKYMDLQKIMGDGLLNLRTKGSKYNIMFFIICHVGKEIPIDPRIPQKRQWKSMGTQEKILGNKKLFFEADFGIHLHKFLYTRAEDMEDKTKMDGVMAVEGLIVKSRFGTSSRDEAEFSMMHTGIGFDPMGSLIMDVVDRMKFLTHKTAGLYEMPGYEKRFYKKDILKLSNTDSDFRRAFVCNINKYYAPFLDQSEAIEKLRNNEELVDLMFS